MEDRCARKEDGLKRYGARRDANERAIISGLVAHGCAVQQQEPPQPDLLVSYNGVLDQLEVKDHDHGIATRSPMRGKGNTLDGPKASLTPSQVKWWAAWEAAGGKLPVIVHNLEEALAAVGASAKEPSE